MTLHFPTHSLEIRTGDLIYPLREPQHRHHPEPPKFTMIFEKTMAGSPAQFDAFPTAVRAEVQDLLMAGGRRPYTHQAETSNLFLTEGKNVALITPTASGKTVSFLAPTLTTLLENPSSTALMLYPMNALAADQLKVLQSIGFKEGDSGLFELPIGGTVIRAGILTGETSAKSRTPVRKAANLLITNHVALHHALLAQAWRQYKDGSGWSRFLTALKVIVLDEGHSYNGVQGTNAALTFRRLSSLVYKLSGLNPQVLMASATIGNPLEHAQNLTGLDNWALVDQSGAASQNRDLFIVQPDLHPSGRGLWPASLVAHDIAMEEVRHHRKVLIFCASRNTTEKMADRLNEKLGSAAAIPYHAGIPVEDKRAFLAQILAGQAEIVCTTSALELGVDIGSMNTVILVGHPGDNASFNQRAGRVGRTSPGRVFLVLDEGQHPLNIYLCGNPEALFWPPECRTIYPLNKIIATRHAACSFLETKDASLVHKAFPNVLDEEVQAGIADKPYERIAMVGLGNFGHFKALDPAGKVIQELGGETALLYWHLHAAIRNVKGQFYAVEKVDLKQQKVLTTSMGDNCRTHTTPRIQTEKTAIPGTLAVLTDLSIAGIVGALAGEFDVSRSTVAYTTTSEGDPKEGPYQAEIHTLEFDEINPPIVIRTRGVQFALKIDHPLSQSMLETTEGIETVQDALGLAVPLLVQARAQDVPVEIAIDGDLVTLFVFDMAEGGMGWAEQLAPRLDRWLIAAGMALLNCSCQMKGCPRCSLSKTRGEKRKRLAEALINAGKPSA